MAIRNEDKVVFLQAAARFGVWILVRDTNAASLAYMGQCGSNGRLAYTPKPIDCKPKTADLDAGAFLNNGLVADPVKVRAAFSRDRLTKARNIWDKFAHEQDVYNEKSPSPSRVDLDARSPHYGCLKKNGLYLHGDYDLKDIIRIGEPNLAAVNELNDEVHMESRWFKRIQAFVNGAIVSNDQHVPMIQHGGEAQFADHSADLIYFFGPAGEHFTMQNQAEISEWYGEIRRAVIDLNTMSSGPRQGPAPDFGSLPGARRHGHLWSLPGGAS